MIKRTVTPSGINGVANFFPPPFSSLQGEGQALLPIRQDWFQSQEQRMRHC
jgi:hypothetical protein